LCYVVKRNQFEFVAFLIDTFILVWAIIHWQELRGQTWIVLLISLLTGYLWQIYNIYAHYKDTLKKATYEEGTRPIVAPNSDNKYKLSEDVDNRYEPISGIPDFVKLKSDYSFLTNEGPISIEQNKNKAHNTEILIDSMWPVLSVFLNEKYHSTRNFHNEKKLCLASEITKKGNQWEASVCEGNYYNSYLTNSIYNTYLLESGSGSHFYPPYCALNEEIQLLERSKMSDHIGVSTLLRASDGKICLPVQVKDAAYNSRKVVPTGSGSVDYDDAKGTKDLRQIIIRAAERELKEETLFDAQEWRDKQINVQTRIIGFYRDLSRGGKPEFCCVTDVPLPSEQIPIHPQKLEQYERFNDFYKIKECLEEKLQIFKEFAISDTLRANLYFLKSLSD